MPKIANLSFEKRLLPWLIVSSLLTCSSGFILYFLQGKNTYAQLTGLLHIMVGLPWAAIFLYYLVIHFARTIGSRKLGLNTSGVLLTLLGIGIIISGLLLTWTGFTASMSLYHWLFSIALIMLSLLHILQNRINIKNSAKAKQSLPLIKNNTLLTSLLLIFLVSGAIALISQVIQYDDSHFYKTVPNYQKNYGENPFAPSNLKTPQQQFIQTHAIAGSQNCQQCHTDIYQQWQTSIHKLAAADPAYVRNVILLENKKGIAATRYCEGCHAPIAMLTGELTQGGKHGGIENTPAFDEGISCRTCHNTDSIVSTEGVASYHFTPTASTIFELSDTSIGNAINTLITRTLPASHKQAFGNPILKTATFCATCHAQFMDERMNDWGWVKMQDDYSAWLNSPYSGHNDDTYSLTKPVLCQDCHMPLVDANDPSSNEEGKVRSHQFLAANTFVANHFGHQKHLDQTIDFLQQNKMRINIEEPRRKDNTETTLTVDEKLKHHAETPYFAYLGETIPLNILVSNIGVGHDFPGGSIDINQAWLHLEVLDAQNQPIFISGNTDEKGNLDQSAHMYKGTPISRQGQEVWRHDLFNMTGESYRNVIKSGQSDLVNYRITIPSWAKSPVTVYATLKYRKLNKQYSDWVMEGKPYTIPVVDVARASLQIPIVKERPVY